MPEQRNDEPPGVRPLRELLLKKGYLGLLLLSAVIGIPISFAAFGFVSLEHELQHWIWESLPEAAGFDRAPWWWPMPLMLLAGLLTAPVIIWMPGHGGHVPVDGLGGRPTLPREVPGVVIAALFCLPLGSVLGPEAPLMAMGSGLALLAVRSARRSAAPQMVPVLGAAGSTAAISTIFGSPLVAAVMMIEAAGLGGPQLVALILPCLLASGIGALVFTGFGHWTGLSIGALSLPSVPSAGLPDPGDFVWGIPLAVVVAAVCVGGRALGRGAKAFTGGHRPAQTYLRTVLCAVGAGASLTAYAVLTDRNPEQDALSGQATLGALAADPSSWPIGALIALVLFKAVAWGLCLGSLRGGPIFPAVLIGAALGVVFAPLPGLGTTPGLGAGLAAAAAAVTRLPVTSTVLAAVLIGSQSTTQMPLLIVASVTGFLTGELLQRPRRTPSDRGGEPAPVSAHP